MSRLRRGSAKPAPTAAGKTGTLVTMLDPSGRRSPTPSWTGCDDRKSGFGGSKRVSTVEEAKAARTVAKTRKRTIRRKPVKHIEASVDAPKKTKRKTTMTHRTLEAHEARRTGAAARR